MSRDLPRCDAAGQQVDPAAVLAFVDAVDADPAIELHSLMVVRHGQVVAEGWWAPHTPERTRLLYSVSKSFTATAAGLAAGDYVPRARWTALWMAKQAGKRAGGTLYLRVRARLLHASPGVRWGDSLPDGSDDLSQV